MYNIKKENFKDWEWEIIYLISENMFFWVNWPNMDFSNIDEWVRVAQTYPTDDIEEEWEIARGYDETEESWGYYSPAREAGIDNE